MLNYKEKFDPNYYADLANDSAMIQAAVDEAAKYGEAVTIPRRNMRTGENLWSIERAIKLHSGSIVYLDNCYLRQADDVFENVFRNSNNGAENGLTREGRQYDIQIIGKGNCIIDGGKHNGMTEVNHSHSGMPHIIDNSVFNFCNAERITIKDIRILNQRYWAFVFHYCSHGNISGIDFFAPHTVRNQDGIDLRTGCSHFNIENLSGVTGDDVVALTCLSNPRDEIMRKEGFDDSIHNVVIRNIRAISRCAFVRILNHDGKKIYNVLVEDIMEGINIDPMDASAKEKGISLKQYNDIRRTNIGVIIGENKYFKDGNMAKEGDTYNITVRNVFTRARAGVYLGCTVTDSLIDNIRLFGDGNTAVYFAEGNMKNLRISNIHYTQSCDPNRQFNTRLFDENPDKEPDFEKFNCAVFFKGTKMENVTFRDIDANGNLDAVFGGTGSIVAEASGIRRSNPETPLIDGEGIDIKLID
ncbi:MAG: hypothetical protein IKB93_12780 [Clostridia bacterium]|nr:hypothetical protein [Clostridia bacterium]